MLYRPPAEKKIVEVTAYHQTEPQVVVWVRYFDTKTGRFVREGKTN